MANKVVTDTFEKLGEQVKDTAKAVASEPKKILEQALGKSDGEAAPEEQGSTGGGSKQAQAGQKKKGDDGLLHKKRLEDREKSQKLLQLHRQRLKEEEEYQRRTVTEEEQQEQLEEQQRQQEERERIVQLERQRAAEAVLQPGSGKQDGSAGPMSAAKKKKGTKELNRQKD